LGSWPAGEVDALYAAEMLNLTELANGSGIEIPAAIDLIDFRMDHAVTTIDHN
jgi:hypothetical protein